MEFITFIWPLMAYILKFIGVLFILYCLGAWWANPTGITPIVRNIIRYSIFLIIFPFMLVIGYIMRAITHPNDRP